MVISMIQPEAVCISQESVFMNGKKIISRTASANGAMLVSQQIGPESPAPRVVPNPIQ